MDLEQRVRELCLARKAAMIPYSGNPRLSRALAASLRRLCEEFEAEYGLYEQSEAALEWLSD